MILESTDENLHDDLMEVLDDSPPELDVDSNWSFIDTTSKKSRRFFGGKAKADETPKRKPGRKKNLTQPITDGITTLAAVLSFVRPITGFAMIDRAEDIAEALNDLAKDNEALYRMLERMTTGGKWGALATASFPVVCAAYVETTGGQSYLGTQATHIMANGLSDATMAKILTVMDRG